MLHKIFQRQRRMEKLTEGARRAGQGPTGQGLGKSCNFLLQEDGVFLRNDNANSNTLCGKIFSSRSINEQVRRQREDRGISKQLKQAR